MLSRPEATARICASLPELSAQGVHIDQACGRQLRGDVQATRALPPWDNSAMDGFAVRAAETPGTLPVSGTVAAGDAPGATLAVGTVMRIMTGAPVPDGADAIVMRENVADNGDTAHFAEAGPLHRHIRRCGEDVAIGQTVLSGGTLLGAGEIGLLAALGHHTVCVSRRPRVAILSTGDELIDVDQAPEPGQIVNSNAYALAAQIRECGGIGVHLGIAPDERDATLAKLREGLDYDAMVTSGGVSVGDFDFVKDALPEIGVTIDFWKVAIKPGKPLVFGRTEAGNPVWGLPGNPVSSMVVFELFVRPALLQMQSAAVCARPAARVQMGSAYTKPTGRTHFLRAVLVRSERDGPLEARTHEKQGSGMLTSMVGVDALIEIPADQTSVAQGEWVTAHLLRAC